MTIYFGSVLLNPAAGARRGSLPVGVQEAHQPVDVSAHFGAVKKQAVEPRHAASDEFYHKPYVNHGEQRADAHDGAAGHLGHNLVGQGDAFERGGEGHVEVDEHTEHKAYHKLQELERRELTAQNDYLRPYEQYIQDVGVHAERQKGDITFGACDGKSQWD